MFIHIYISTFTPQVHAAEEKLLAMKELEAEWAREAQGASDSDDDVVLVEPKRAAQGGGGRHLSLAKPLNARLPHLPIVTCHLHRRGGEEEEG